MNTSSGKPGGLSRGQRRALSRSSGHRRPGRMEPDVSPSSTSTPTGLPGSSIANGVKPGDRVGVIVPKGARAITAFFGIMKARAAYVPADYTAPAARNRSILADCQVKVAFLAPSCAPMLDEWPDESRAAVGCRVSWRDAARERLLHTQFFTWDQAVRHAPARVDGRAPTRPCVHPVYVRVDGCAEGRDAEPRECAQLRGLVLRCLRVRPRPIASAATRPFHFDLSVLDIYVAVKHGATLYVISEELGKSPEELAAFIAERRLTVWYSTPSILSLLAQFGNLTGRDCRIPAARALCGRSVSRSSICGRSRDSGRGPTYYNLYGPTETNVCTFARIPLPVPDERTVPVSDWGAVRSLRDDWCSTRQAQRSAQQKKDCCMSLGLRSSLATGIVPNRTPERFSNGTGRRWYNTGDVVRLELRWVRVSRPPRPDGEAPRLQN